MTLCFAASVPLLRPRFSSSVASASPLRPLPLPSRRARSPRAPAMSTLTTLPATRTDLGPRIVVVGGNRGLGLAMVNEVAKKEGRQVLATCRCNSAEVSMKKAGENVSVVSGIDVGENDCGENLVKAVKELGWSDISTLMIVAGVFTQDTLDGLDADKFDACMNMYNVCAVGTYCQCRRPPDSVC